MLAAAPAMLRDKAIIIAIVAQALVAFGRTALKSNWLLALGVAALWWYVVAFNDVPPPIDYAGLWNAPLQTIFIDGVVLAALVATSSVLLRRRSL